MGMKNFFKPAPDAALLHDDKNLSTAFGAPKARAKP
jgi:hypothetical protein